MGLLSNEADPLTLPDVRYNLIFIVACLFEGFSGSNLLFLVIYDDKTPSFIIYSVTTVPRFLFFMWAARSMCPSKWYKYIVTFDSMLMQALLVIMLYAWMLAKAEEASGAFVWRVISIVNLPLYYFSFMTHFRCMLKYYPWTRMSIFIYKFMRLFTVLATTSFQVMSKSLSVSNLDSALLALYLGVFISFNTGLLARIPSWTQHRRGMAKRTQDAEMRKEKRLAEATKMLLGDVQTVPLEGTQVNRQPTLYDPSYESNQRALISQ